jgi:cell division transport system ATP-binding protein
VIRDEASALYTSISPVVGQSRRLKDASGLNDPDGPEWTEPGAPSAGEGMQ